MLDTEKDIRKLPGFGDVSAANLEKITLSVDSMSSFKAFRFDEQLSSHLKQSKAVLDHIDVMQREMCSGSTHAIVKALCNFEEAVPDNMMANLLKDLFEQEIDTWLRNHTPHWGGDAELFEADSPAQKDSDAYLFKQGGKVSARETRLTMQELRHDLIQLAHKEVEVPETSEQMRVIEWARVKVDPHDATFSTQEVRTKAAEHDASIIDVLTSSLRTLALKYESRNWILKWFLESLRRATTRGQYGFFAYKSYLIPLDGSMMQRFPWSVVGWYCNIIVNQQIVDPSVFNVNARFQLAFENLASRVVLRFRATLLQFIIALEGRIEKTDNLRSKMLATAVTGTLSLVSFIGQTMARHYDLSSMQFNMSGTI